MPAKVRTCAYANAECVDSSPPKKPLPALPDPDVSRMTERQLIRLALEESVRACPFEGGCGWGVGAGWLQQCCASVTVCGRCFTFTTDLTRKDACNWQMKA